MVLDVELHRDRLASDADDLLDQRDVVEVGPERPDLPVAEVGHGDAGQLDVPSRCFQHDVLAEDEWSRVVGFDEPFGERLVARLRRVLGP